MTPPLLSSSLPAQTSSTSRPSGVLSDALVRAAGTYGSNDGQLLPRAGVSDCPGKNLANTQSRGRCTSRLHFGPPMPGRRALVDPNQARRAHQDGPVVRDDAGDSVLRWRAAGCVGARRRSQGHARADPRPPNRNAGSPALTPTGALVPAAPRSRNAHRSALDQGTPGLNGPAKLLSSLGADRVEELIQRMEVACARQTRHENAIGRLLPAWSLVGVVTAIQATRGVAAVRRDPGGPDR